MKKMCEYCLDEWYKRNIYEIKGDVSDYDVEGKVELNGEEGLDIHFSWNDETRKEKDGRPVRMGLAAAVLIRYCPWCGRKLGEEENVQEM